MVVVVSSSVGRGDDGGGDIVLSSPQSLRVDDDLQTKNHCFHDDI